MGDAGSTNGHASGATDARLDQLAQSTRGERTLSRVRAYLIPLAISAILLALAFPYPGWGWLAHVALVPAAVVAIRAGSAKRLAWCAAIVFVVWWIVMLRWLLPVTAGGYILLAAFMAMWSVVALLALHWLHRRWGLLAVITLPIAWVSIEVIRDHVPAGGLGWYMLGYTQLGHGPEHGVGRIAQVADLFGVYGVSVLVAMTNGFLVDLLTRPLTHRTDAGATRPGHGVLAALILWLAAIVGAGAYGNHRLAEHDRLATAGPRVAVVQTNVPQDNKMSPDPAQIEADWQDLLALTRRAADRDPKPDLIVWPETVVPTALNREARPYTRFAEHYDREIAQIARDLDTPIVVGALAYREFLPHRSATGERIALPELNHNSVYLYDRTGEQADARYDKVHRVPFGEFIPWVERSPMLKELFIRYLTPYDHDYTLDPGERFTVFEIGDNASPLRFATPICFEDAVGRVTRRMVYGSGGEKRVDALLNLTNDGWFHGLGSGGAMRAQHVQMAAMRTIETRTPMARSVNTGHSAIIDSVGRVRAVVEDDAGRRRDVAGVIDAELTLDPRLSPYGRMGEWPAWGLVALATALALGGYRRRVKIADDRADA